MLVAEQSFQLYRTKNYAATLDGQFEREEDLNQVLTNYTSNVLFLSRIRYMLNQMVDDSGGYGTVLPKVRNRVAQVTELLEGTKSALFGLTEAARGLRVRLSYLIEQDKVRMLDGEEG